MNEIPEQFKKFAESAELYDQCEVIGEKFGLHLDQIGELDAEIRDILTGASQSKDFTSHIVERLEITPKLANDIAQEVTKEVFSALRTKLQSQVTNSQPTSSISSLERMGGFSLEKEAPESGGEVTAADRSDILAGLENPPASVPSHTGTPPANLPTDTRSATMPPAENHTEPLVDYLLSTPAGRSTQKVSIATPTTLATQKPLSPPVPQKPKNDPYKEAI